MPENSIFTKSDMNMANLSGASSFCGPCFGEVRFKKWHPRTVGNEGRLHSIADKKILSEK